MRKLTILAIGFLLCSASVAIAADAKIAVINLERVFKESEAGKSIRTTLDTKFGAKKTALAAENKAIVDEMQKLGDKKPPKELEDKQKQFNEKFNALATLVQADEERVAREMDRLINDSTKAIVARKGYTLVIDRRSVTYCDSSIDITNDVLTEMNAEWKKTANQ